MESLLTAYLWADEPIRVVCGWILWMWREVGNAINRV